MFVEDDVGTVPVGHVRATRSTKSSPL